jgi:hypothetical protein
MGMRHYVFIIHKLVASKQDNAKLVRNGLQ